VRKNDTSVNHLTKSKKYETIESANGRTNGAQFGRHFAFLWRKPIKERLFTEICKSDWGSSPEVQNMADTKYPEMNEAEKAEMWETIADWFALPEEERAPKFQKDLYEFYKIPERTFYDKTAKNEYQALITKKSLSKVKKRLPEVLKALQIKAEGGSEKAIEMFLEYVAELFKRMDITSGGDKINPLLVKFIDGTDNGNTDRIQESVQK
jgi:hypothetical protein